MSQWSLALAPLTEDLGSQSPYGGWLTDICNFFSKESDALLWSPRTVGTAYGAQMHM